MEDLRKSPMELKHKEQPVKTEWGNRCVIFTYYQGDINSVVDEHFSRALRNTKDPQDLSMKNRTDDILQKNVNNMAADEMNCTPQWTKSYQTTPPLNMTSSVLTPLASSAEHYPASVFQAHHTQPTDLWHFHHIGTQNAVGSVYSPHSMPEYQMIPGAGPDGKCGSLLSLLQPDRFQVPLQESMMKQEHVTPVSTCHIGPENLNQRMNTQGGLHSQERRKEYFHPQDRRKDLYYF
ncbi:transcription cofactor vestigial-like protein 1 isoform 1-T2 [Discoglossus pictus]